MKRIAIIGSGSAGAATALFLHKQKDIAVTLIEREAEPRPVGAGFMLQLTGLQVLDKLGLRAAVQALGHEIHHINGHNKRGKKILNLNFKKVNENFTGVGIHRGVFFSLMHQKLQEHHIPIITDCEVIDVRYQDNQSYILNQKNELLGPYDLVVVANGASSKLRDKYAIAKKTKRQVWGAAWAVLPYHSHEFDHSIFQVYHKNKQMVGVMPIGKKSTNDHQRYINLFWSLHMGSVAAWKDKGVEAWKKELVALAPSLKGITEHITSFEQVMTAPYYDVCLSPYHDKNVVFIGDAAHAMSPQLSCGVNNALLDAQALAKHLIEQTDWNIALKAFYTTRKKHNLFYQQLCRVITPLFQSNIQFLATLRDIVFGNFLTGKFSSMMMVENTLGVREGLFKRLNRKYYFIPNEEGK